MPELPPELSQEEQQRIVAALESRGAKLPCPRCANATFTLVSGYVSQSVQTQLGGLVIGGPRIPSVAVICTRCGFISHHALGTLGLLPKSLAEQGEAGR